MLLSILSVLTAVSTCIIPASGQQTCQTEILQNSTVDIDKYLNNEFHILATFATPPPDALSNCILRCCNQSNCSLAIHNATDNHTCTLIHCVSEDACKPIPSDGSEIVKTIRNNITTTESLSENQSQTTESTSDTSTTASGIGLSTSSRGDHSTSSQQSTTQDYNDFLTSNIGYPITETSQSTNEVLSTTLSVSTSSVPSGQDQTSTTESTSLQNTDIFSTIPANTTNQNSIFSSTSPSNSTSSSSNMTTTNPEGTTTNYNNFTESFNTTTTTTLINNATESSNYTIMSVTPNLSENGNVSVTDDVNVTFSQSNDTENSTIDSNLNQNVTSSKQETYLKNEADSNNTLMITVLIGTLSVGTLLFVAVIVVISKKIIDGWQKRHYSRIDYLVNGMYN
ncbi:uncharacterized protein DDB_G0271670 isoform X1 [Octopus sinensis]|uniref:Uncharacterized protein DDB_G0271670 isoform X1 n=1 Tax=Octopus sinensis TaxID=2607531 RepID=A0A6P7SNM4_9MOLL|nr:uncharacterized protein DDB_G0271670 isoform X1 [Octopus sinensis]XP_036361358.1 uncharacterized protein DDB_G0271670 isoform X1 [Octopus sinensis]XP_036361359.1 uncharacterized protein DDB_G0271670 isoform X1 [Octopus sinensis]